MKEHVFRFVIPSMQMSRKHIKLARKGKTAFSLVELLVVIGVIAVLLAIILTILHEAYKAVRAMRG